MPWSPLKYTENIFKDLLDKGYEEYVTTEVLFSTIMKHTQLIREITIKNVIKAFRTLGYIEASADGVWRIKYGKTLTKTADDNLEKYDGLIK